MAKLKKLEKWLVTTLVLLVLLAGCSNLCGWRIGDDTVRQPTGDVESFWDGFSWDELTSAEQALWEILGWDEASWSGLSAPPASDLKLWSQLSETERSAASDLGYTQLSWEMS